MNETYTVTKSYFYNIKLKGFAICSSLYKYIHVWLYTVSTICCFHVLPFLSNKFISCINPEMPKSYLPSVLPSSYKYQLLFIRHISAEKVTAHIENKSYINLFQYLNPPRGFYEDLLCMCNITE